MEVRVCMLVEDYVHDVSSWIRNKISWTISRFILRDVLRILIHTRQVFRHVRKPMAASEQWTHVLPDRSNQLYTFMTKDIRASLSPDADAAVASVKICGLVLAAYVPLGRWRQLCP